MSPATDPDGKIPPQTNPPRSMPSIITPPGSTPAMHPGDPRSTTVPGILSAPQPVGPMNTPGLGPGQALFDHVHKGVSRIIPGSNITISPSSGIGPVTISASGGGGGNLGTHICLVHWSDSVATFPFNTNDVICGYGASTPTVVYDPFSMFSVSTEKFTFSRAANWVFQASFTASVTYPYPNALGYGAVVDSVYTVFSSPAQQLHQGYSVIPTASDGSTEVNGGIGAVSTFFASAIFIPSIQGIRWNGQGGTQVAWNASMVDGAPALGASLNTSMGFTDIYTLLAEINH